MGAHSSTKREQHQPTLDQPQMSGEREDGEELTPCCPTKNVQHMGQTLVASDETRTSGGGEPRITLANDSDYTVSFWVVQEDKKRTKAHRKYIVKSMGAKARVGMNGGEISGDFARHAEETVDLEENQYLLMRDCRMAPKGVTNPTHVNFPAGCKDLRVFGFFEQGGEWHCYKEKVYSIGRPIYGFLPNKTKHKLTALNSNIKSYAGFPYPGSLEVREGNKIAL